MTANPQPRAPRPSRSPEYLRPAAGAAASAAPGLEPMVRDLLLRLDDPELPLDQYVGELLGAGVSAEQFCLDIVTPAARILGERWESDEASFVTVTLGVTRLQQMVHRVGDRLRSAEDPGITGNALLSVFPGDQHSLGIVMVAEFLRRDGWVVSPHPDCDSPEFLVRSVGRETYDVVMISVGRTTPLGRLRRLIIRLRKGSCNRELVVLVGGPMVLAEPELVDGVGADGSAVDAAAAVTLARQFVSRSGPA